MAVRFYFYHTGRIIMSFNRSDLGNIDFSDIEDTSVPPVGPTHPGQILRDHWLGPMGITPYRAAMDMGVPPNRLTGILAGNRGITADTAERLGLYFGVDAQFWMNLQTRYELERLDVAEIARTVKPLNRAAA
jgi:addiction module HigA family antidote